MHKITKITSGKAAITDRILRDIPEWFGIEEAIVNYVKEVEPMPFWVAESDGQAVGCLAVKQHYPKSAEIFVMGILRKYHRQGIGKLLVEESEHWLREQGFQYYQVKTLSESRENKEYAETREFYYSMGFVPLEEFPTLWDEANPCLLMVKRI